MGTLQTDNEKVVEMNDSGCIHDDNSPPKKMAEPLAAENGKLRVHLLDLSDDVLLYILRYCSAMDLKALGYTCARLGALVLDRSLWQRVDAGEAPVGKDRLSWLLAHALHSGTESLKLHGYAKLTKGCLGYVNLTRKEVENGENWGKENVDGGDDGDNNNTTSDEPGPSTGNRQRSPRATSAESNLSTMERLQNHLQISIQQLPRLSGTPLWPDEDPPLPTGDPSQFPPDACPGPLFTVTPSLLVQLRTQCPNLTTLALEYCNINGKTTSPNLFPPTLKWLSFRGTKCYNIPLDKSFLFKIQDNLLDLEYLDVSECDWFEPASLMPISKIPRLRELRAAHCPRLAEFVAYASIACRYGFRNLERMELCGSPVADSEVAALGWLPLLQELRLSAPRRGPSVPRHTHYRGEPLPPLADLAPWELPEPEYYERHRIETSESLPETTVVEGGHADPETRAKNFDKVTLINLLQNDYAVTAPIFIGNPERARQDNNQLQPNEPGAAQNTKRRHKENQEDESKEEPSSKKKKRPGQNNPSTSKETSDSDSDDDSAPKPTRNGINCGASTSRSSEKPKREKYVRFNPVVIEYPRPDSPPDQLLSLSINRHQQNIESDRQNEEINQQKVRSTEQDKLNILQNGESRQIQENNDRVDQNRSENNQSREESSRQSAGDDERNEENGEQSAENGELAAENGGQRMENGQRRLQPNAVIISGGPNNVHPRHQVLYVNVGQQLHAIYRLSIENERSICEPLCRSRNQSNLQNLLFCQPHLSVAEADPIPLVTDTSIRRFGHADHSNINYVNIGRNGPVPVVTDPRLQRSSLRVLSVTGYRYITNASLMHLATAAPHLRFVDFSDTMVTPQGVEYFKSLRPDVEVRFSKISDSDESDTD